MTPAMMSDRVIGNGFAAIHQIGRHLRREEQSVYNRLLSVQHDAQYVQTFRKANPSLPTFANLRCGQWYDSSFDSTCYFKSTDGHCGYWKFNLRRFNAQLAFKAAEKEVIVLVDSTRKGKRHPDAFTRTIPIWIAVVNQVVYLLNNQVQDKTDCDFSAIPDAWRQLEMPEWIPSTEKALVTEKVQEFARLLLQADSMRPTLRDLASRLSKPLRAFWICPQTFPSNSTMSLELPRDKFNWIILLCPSDEQEVTQQYLPWYIQGAADDEETWSQGLTAELFWKHEKELLAREDEISDVIARLIEEDKQQTAKMVKEGGMSVSLTGEEAEEDVWSEEAVHWIVAGKLGVSDDATLVSRSPATLWRHFDLILNCSSMPYEVLASTLAQYPGKRYMHLVDPFEKGQNAKFKLSQRLPGTLEFVRRYCYFRSRPATSASTASIDLTEFATSSGSATSTMKAVNSPITEDSTSAASPSLTPASSSDGTLRLLIHGVNAMDIAVGLAIAILSAHFAEDGISALPSERLRNQISKPLLRHFLLHVSKLVPQQLPSVMVSDLSRYFLSTPDPKIREQHIRLASMVP